MSALVQLRGVGHHAGPRTLFSGIDLVLAPGDRLGLVGANGSGKSTLMRILAGHLEATGGERSAGRHLRAAFLDQEPALEAGATALQWMLRRLERDPGPPPDQEAEVAARRSLGLAGFDDPDRRIEEFSGGWRRRLALAAELATGPDLLLLDEPTNHLDLDGILWLEEELLRRRTTLVVVSHDRRFLERVCTRMAEIDPRHPGGFFVAEGSWSEFIEKREEAFRELRDREASLNSQLREEIRYLRQGPKARTSKNATRVARAHETIAEFDRVRALNREREMDAGFTETGRRTRRLLVAEGVTLQPGGDACCVGLDLVLTPGRRVGLVGPNGGGKTTLLRTLLGERAPEEGTVRPAPGLRVVYFDQARESLDPRSRLRHALSPEGDTVTVAGRRLHVKSWARQLLFRDDQLDQEVRTLSGGERARLLVARLMSTPADVLLLDEPTNDLDIPTLEALETSLMDFDGAVVLVSHDRYLMERVCTDVLALDGRGAHAELADLAQWESWRKAGSAPPRQPAKPRKPAPAAERPKERKRLSYNEQRELSLMEEKVLEAEERVQEAQRQAALPEVQADPEALQRVYAELSEAQAGVDRLYERWAELDSRS